MSAKKILLIFPIFESKHHVFKGKVATRRAFMTPAGIATVAALTPPEYDVTLWDENIQGLFTEDEQEKMKFDLVGVTGFSSQINRVRELAAMFKRYNVPVGLGGPAVSTSPERYIDFGDHLFIGEAEFIWPQFLKDWENGQTRRMYRQVIKPELSATPVPRWELMGKHLTKYFVGAVQTSRGCPYDCEFCDVPYIFGHRPRAKPIPEVLKEVEHLKNLGVEQVFFCDDNFIGDLKYTKALLKELAVFNRKFDRPVNFFTPLTLNVAKQDEVLGLMMESNFAGLFIGIETINKESLKETKKFQNAYTDILNDVKKVQSYGMALWSGVIVGFDHDSPSIFQEQFDFLQEASIPMPVIHLLHAPEGTKLMQRMQKEGRLLVGEDEPTMPKTWTNVMPKGMTRKELLEGHLWLHEQVRDWDNFAARIKGFISGIKYQRTVKETPRRKAAGALLEFIIRRTPFLFPRLKPLGLEGKARKTVMELLEYSLDVAPFLFPRMIAPLIIMQLRYVELLKQTRPLMQRQIDLECSPGFTYEYAKDTDPIPESFVHQYPKVFPGVYSTVLSGLTDKSRVEETLVEIFTEYISRWNTTLDNFSSVHEQDLESTALDVVQRINTSKPRFGLIQLANMPQHDNKRSKLPEEVLRAAEQQLRIKAAAEMPSFHAVGA